MSLPRFAKPAAVLAAAALLLTGCGSGAQEGGDGTVALPHVSTVVSYPTLPSGIEQGIFDEAFDTDASEMTIEHVSTGAEGAQALIAGHTDIAIGGYFSQGLVGPGDVRIVAISETSPETHAVLVAPGSGLGSIEDLEGTTVGSFSATLPPFLALMLEQAGLDQSFFNYIQVPNDGGLAALTSGAIDAWYTFDPFYAQAEIEGLADVIVDGTDFYLNPIVVMTTQGYLDENPDSVKTFLDAYVDSTEWVNANIDAAAQYMADATGMTPEAADITVSRRNYEVVVPSEEAVSWMDLLGQAEVNLGILDEVPDFDTVIDTTVLEEVLAQ